MLHSSIMEFKNNKNLKIISIYTRIFLRNSDPLYFEICVGVRYHL